jgi:hypothetical protein
MTPARAPSGPHGPSGRPRSPVMMGRARPWGPCVRLIRKQSRAEQPIKVFPRNTGTALGAREKKERKQSRAEQSMHIALGFVVERIVHRAFLTFPIFMPISMNCDDFRPLPSLNGFFVMSDHHSTLFTFVI